MKRKSPTRRPSFDVDIAVSHPRDGQMRLISRYLFADPKAEVCQRFIGKIFEVEEVCSVEILAARAQAHIEYASAGGPCREVVGKISRHLRNGAHPPHASSPGELPVPFVDRVERWRVERHGDVLSTWEIKHELPGRIRFRNRLIQRNREVGRAIDRALRHALGVERYTTNPHTATTLIVYDPAKLQRQQLIRILDQVLVDAYRPDRKDVTEPGRSRDARVAARTEINAKEHPPSGRELTLLSLSLAVAGIGNVFYPPMSVLSVPGTAYASRRLYRSGFRSLVYQRQATVETLLIAVHAMSLIGGYYFLFCLGSLTFELARKLLDKVKQDSRADYTDIFRQQTRTVWVRVDGVDVETSLDAVKVGDLVSISAGQTIPVDGRIAEGAATIDQHLLTGEAVPAEKGVGDTVFALTVVLSGRIGIHVEKTGAATAAAHIARVLDMTVDFKTNRKLRAERLADRLVLPAFLSGLLTWPVLGATAGAAMVDSHPKNKLTLAYSLGLLNYFKLAARRGLLINDGRTLELLSEVDTVVFDKTGTLTLAQPHVGRVYTRSLYSANDVLAFAAAAEQRQSHPIAKAIMQAAAARGLSTPPLDQADYKVGYGLTVTIDRRMVCVGSVRFMEMEGIAIPPALADIQTRCHDQDHSLVLVAIDGDIAGAIELHSTIRPEARRIVQGLRQRNIRSIYVISGDHEVPTRRLAEALGIDHYFAETLPENKAALIEQLQAAGKVICYVGDGINDSIAMKKAHVSVSMRGASTVAIDTAEVVLLDESLNQLCQLFDLARECQKSMRTTMASALLPSVLSIGGILFFNFTFVHARVLHVVGAVTSVGAAMLPLLTRRQTPQPSGAPELSDRASAELLVEERVIEAELAGPMASDSRR